MFTKNEVTGKSSKGRNLKPWQPDDRKCMKAFPVRRSYSCKLPKLFQPEGRKCFNMHAGITDTQSLSPVRLF